MSFWYILIYSIAKDYRTHSCLTDVFKPAKSVEENLFTFKVKNSQKCLNFFKI